MSDCSPQPGERAVLHDASTNHLSLLVVNPIGAWEYIGTFFPDVPALTWYPHIVYEAELRRHRPADLPTQEWAWELLSRARLRALRGQTLAGLATHYITAPPERPDFAMRLAPLRRETNPGPSAGELETLALF